MHTGPTQIQLNLLKQKNTKEKRTKRKSEEEKKNGIIEWKN